jgi:6-bladed beta-propeller
VRAGLILLGLALAGCDGASRGAPRVPHWDIAEELRIGGAETGPSSLSDVRGLAVDAAGRIFVLDFQAQQIQLFDSTGAYLRSIGRHGAGPGEFSNANGMLRAPDGRLWINDPLNNRFTVLDPEGKLLISHPVRTSGYGYRWDAWFSAAGVLHELVLVRQDTSWVPRIRRFGAADLGADTLPQYPCGSTPDEVAGMLYRTPRGLMQVPYAPSGHSAVDPQGYLWCSAARGYHIVKVRLERPETTAVISGTRPPVPLNAAERDSARTQVRDFYRKTGGADPDLSRIPAVKPALLALDVDDAGRLWARAGTAEAGTVFDVYDARGGPVAEAHAPFAISAFRPIIFRGDRLYTIVTDADGVPFVIRARISRH